MNKKTILITGCDSGIGLDAALALVKRGHKIIAAVKDEFNCEKISSLAKENGLLMQIEVLDVVNPEHQNKVLSLDFDVLINNAGIGESGSLAEIPLDKIKNNFEVNLFSPLKISQLALKKFIARDFGQIIFVSSLVGRVPIPFLGSYCMTKFALSSGADVLRQELFEISKNIFVSVVEPGAYHTGFNQRMFASKYKWLDKSSYFNKIIDKIEKREEKMFNLIEQKSTKSIVKKIVKAVESTHPRFRYYAPWWQGWAMQIQRIFGR